MPAIAAGAAVGALMGGAAAPGLVIAGTAISAGAVAGAVIGGFGGKFMEDSMSTDVGDVNVDVPEATVSDIEGQEEGWARLGQRATGRRATILTSPQLGKRKAPTQRATLLAG
jgi:hypothetical protein